MKTIPHSNVYQKHICVLLYIENNHLLLMMGRNLLSFPVQKQCGLNHLLCALCRSRKHLENGNIGKIGHGQKKSVRFSAKAEKCKILFEL